jgi:hypothetical protein
MRVARHNSAHSLKLPSSFDGVVVTYTNNTEITQELKWVNSISTESVQVLPGLSVSRYLLYPWSPPAPVVNRGYFIIERYSYGHLVSRVETNMTGIRVKDCVTSLYSIQPLLVSSWPSDLAAHYDNLIDKGLMTGTSWQYKNMGNFIKFFTVGCVLVGVKSGFPGIYLITMMGRVFCLYGDNVPYTVAKPIHIDWLEPSVDMGAIRLNPVRSSQWR